MKTRSNRLILQLLILTLISSCGNDDVQNDSVKANLLTDFTWSYYTEKTEILTGNGVYNFKDTVNYVFNKDLTYKKELNTFSFSFGDGTTKPYLNKFYWLGTYTLNDKKIVLQRVLPNKWIPSQTDTVREAWTILKLRDEALIVEVIDGFKKDTLEFSGIKR